jgi:subtilisin-like proprotein convertase family protein
MKFTPIHGAAVAVALTFAAPAHAATFSNTNPIAIPGTGTSGPTDPYPSQISVSGSGIITSLTVSLFGLSHTYPDDIDILLVGPTGANVLLMSDAGGRRDVVGVDLTFDDAAATMLDSIAQIVSGTYQPSNFDAGGSGDTFDAPAAVGPYGSVLAGFVGSNANGTWSLFMDDDTRRDSGSFSGGWALNIQTEVATVPLPASLPLLLAGLGLIGTMRRRKKSDA